MLVMEALGYNRFGCRYISKEEMDARRKFVLSSDVFSEERNFHKPLESYQDGKKSLSELVEARHQDELERLTARYQDFLKFPESRGFGTYQQKKERMNQDYKAQKEWLENDCSDVQKRERESLNRSMLCGLVFQAAGTANACVNTSISPVTATLFYAGAIINFCHAYFLYSELKSIPKEQVQARVVLEDWYEKDRFARYDRILLNDKLKALNKKRPTQIRRDQKRELVAQYRERHPRIRA